MAKILLWDIETSNLKGDIGFMFCAAYRWYGEKKTHLISVRQYKSFKKDPTNDRAAVMALAQVLTEADMWVGQYSTRFDVKFLQTRMLEHGLGALPPRPHVDTWEWARRKLALHSNRLDSIAKHVSGGVSRKTKIDWGLWKKAGAGNAQALRYIEAHCVADIDDLQTAYEGIRPLITTHPNISILESGSTSGCPACASDHLQKRGIRINRTSVVQQYACMSCGAWSHGKAVTIPGGGIR